MSLMETLLIIVGPAVAKTALKRWLEDEDYARDVGVAIIDMLKKKIPDLRTRNKAERDFKRIAEEVAEQLETFLDIEGHDLPENEKEAAAFAVAAAFNQGRITHELLFEKDLDPKALAAHLQEMSPKAATDLSDVATGLYEKMLSECATYVVEITSTLPSFAHESASEMLKREGQILELVQKVLAELPKLSAEGDGEDADRTFESDYRRAIARRLDRLELFGITNDVSSRRYSLSVAYITLTAFKAVKRRAVGPINEQERRGLDYLRVDEALGGSQRILIRGEAGSGKTTLLQWLAVRAAREDFSGALKDWNGQLPFFLQLRRWLKDGLPKPEDYLMRVAPNLIGAKPSGWVTRKLKAGALILIDGVDEVPDHMRQSVKRWIDDLASDFPGCRIVVTSRPAAVKEGWLSRVGLSRKDFSGENFDNGELQPMERGDVEALIDQWHEAAHQIESDGEKRDQLNDYRDSLKAKIRMNRSLRHLATTPLLCAMICSLHLDRKKNVPGDRMDLYRIALDMMLDRREAERGSTFQEFKGLTKRAKESLLRSFAYWLMLNDRSDSERSEAENCLARSQQSLSEFDYEPARLLQFLLERSGLLREHVKDRIDFIHRTFQEFLAAKQAIDDDHVDRLVNNAHLAEWRETIVLAAGHGSQRNCDKLISGLLDRAKQEPKLRHQLILLAVSCLETATNLSPMFRERTRDDLADIMPPKTNDEARAVAEAGELAIPYLQIPLDSNVSEVTACIATLGLIGGDAAIEILKCYVSDSRKIVIKALFVQLADLNALHLMEAVKELSLDGRAFPVLPSLSSLPKLEFLGLSGCRRLTDLVELKGMHRLRHLDLSSCSSLTDLSGLQGLGDLQQLDLSNCSSLENLSGLQGLNGLQSLNLADCKNLTDLSGLQGLSSLQSLILARCNRLTDLSSLQYLSSLQRLNLEGCESLTDLSMVHSLPNLKAVWGISEPQRERFPSCHPARHWS